MRLDTKKRRNENPDRSMRPDPMTTTMMKARDQIKHDPGYEEIPYSTCVLLHLPYIPGG
jgi:hypothetical protein